MRSVAWLPPGGANGSGAPPLANPEPLVTVGGVTHPTFQGFTGVDSLLNGVADAAFLMYEEVAEKILPGAMQTSVRASLNNLTAMYLAAPENLVCPPRPRSARSSTPRRPSRRRSRRSPTGPWPRPRS